MAKSVFEELMLAQRDQLTEGIISAKKKKSAKTEAKKINYKKIKVESLRIFEEENLDDLDNQFDVDPEESQEDEVVLVIDPEIPADEEVPEDAAEDLVGDLVYKCPVCGANYVCDCDAAENESLEVDENGVPTECPVCGDDAEQILIGEIAPAEDAGEEDNLEPQEVEDEEESDELPEDDFSDEEGIPEEDDEVIEDSLKRSRGRRARKESSRRPAKRQIKEDLEDVDDVVSDDFCPECGESPCVCDTGMTLAEPVNGDAPEVVIDADVVNLTLDDGKFESIMTRMIRENYKFNPTFKVTKVVHPKGTDKLRIEYVVREGKSKTTKGTFIAEGFSTKSRSMTLKIKDKGAFTESYTKTPSFVVECVRIRNKIIPTKMSYNFTKRVNESLYRVSGKVEGKTANPTQATRRK